MSAVRLELSDEVTKLVRTVERLPAEDRQRIVRMVDLLLLAPQEVRGQTQQMLRTLVERTPGTKAECVTGVDQIINYLERSLASPLPVSPYARH